jgi:predicted RecA/RadA family phage recombinase
MAENFKQAGGTLTLTPGADVASGTGYLFGTALFGIALTDVASGSAGSFATEGVWELPKTSALAISVGDRVYWDATNKVVNKTTASQECIGVAVSAAANPSASVWVKLGVSVIEGT